MDKKLVVVVMGQNCQKFIGMCLDSIKDADAIIYCDGGSTDNTQEIFNRYINKGCDTAWIGNKWNPEDKAMNGKQRNFYLDFIKKSYPNDWCLTLDADELVEDLSKIKNFINDEYRQDGIYNVKMRHFIGDLGHEDATRLVHVVPGRLFKISEAKGYPLHSHPVLEGKLRGACLDTTIWHLGHLPVEYMDYILRRYKQHSEDSIIHQQDFLKQWKLTHLFGKYPKREINPIDLPKQICDRYEIDKDEFYFANRGLEVKHFLMTKQWSKYFDWDEKVCEFVEFGCGRAPYGYALALMGYDYLGFDISKFAINNSFNTNNGNMEVREGDVTKLTNQNTWKYRVALCIDILEHLKYEDLDVALKNINTFSDNALFSIPFEGDPNLEADPTHIIKESKEWWIEKLSQYFKIKKVPVDWLFASQLLIGEKNEK